MMFIKLIPHTWRTSAGLFILCALFISHAMAEGANPDKAKEYDIQEQELAVALEVFSLISSMQVVYISELMKGKAPVTLIGEYTDSQALTLILQDTGLKYQLISDQTIVISEKKARVKTTPVTTSYLPEKRFDQIDTLPTESVVVTGSRVPRTSFDIPYPTQSIGPLYIERGVHPTLAEGINSLPVMCEPNYSSSTTSNPGNIGEAFGDLYCLGSQRTLTLVNGRRSVSSNEPSVFNQEPGLQVDLNMIPALMLKSIEVIGIGSAPVYGSDAIAGTINISLIDKFEGLKFDINRGVSELEDGEHSKFGMLAGGNFLDERMNFTVAYEYQEREAVLAIDRAYTRRNLDYVRVFPQNNPGQPSNYRFGEYVTDPTRTLSGVPTPLNLESPRFADGSNLFQDSDGVPRTFGNNGRLQPLILGEFTADISTRIGGDGIRAQDGRVLIAPSQRHSFATIASVDLTENTRAFSELQFYTGESSGFPLLGNIIPSELNAEFTSLPVALDTPFLDDGDRGLLQLSSPPIENTFYLYKDWRALIDNEAKSDSNTFRGVLGVGGEMRWKGNSWYWELSLGGGRSTSETKRQRLNQSNFIASLENQIADNGDIVCESEDPRCVPLNPFLMSYSERLKGYVLDEVTEGGAIEQSVVTATIQGDLRELPGGTWAAVLGFEARNESAEYSDRLIMEQSEDTQDFSGSFSTKETFIESVAPLIGSNTLPWVEKFELETNWRNVRHSNSGTNNTWAIAGRLNLGTPERSVLLRGNLTSSIRSPSLFELFRPFTPIDSDLRDLCDSRFVLQQGLDGTRLQSCVDEAEQLLSTYFANSFSSLVPDRAQILVGGTRDLKDEQAKSSTFGVVMRLGNTNTFKLSVDAINIDLEDAIIERDLNRMASECYDLGDSSACDNFIRDPNTFQLIAVNNVYENSGLLSVKALQYNASFAADLYDTLGMPGNIYLDLRGYQLKEFFTESRGIVDDRQGLINYPEWRWSASLDYEVGNFNASWSSFFFSEVEVPLDFDLSQGQLPKVGSYLRHNLSAGLDVFEGLNIHAGVRNVFDTEPPQGLPSRETGGTYDAIGRYYNIGLRYEF